MIKKKKSAVLDSAESSGPKRKPKKKSKKSAPKKKVSVQTESSDEEVAEELKLRKEAGIDKAGSTKTAYSTVDDVVTKKLAKCEKPREMVAILKGHKSFKHINVDAFKRTVKAISDTPAGLIRMRFGNLLRGAIRKMEAPKKVTKKKK